MTVSETYLKGCFLLEPKIFKDERGYFMESYNARTFGFDTGSDIHFVQDNQSFSNRGVIRALHYQLGTHAQSKLVRVIKGVVLDVAVDIRKGSSTFGEHFSVELSEENKKQLFIPKGFAHGFVVLSETAEFFYKCDNYYNKASEGGIIFNDPSLNIDWKLPKEKLIISEKDAILPSLENARL